jgi:AcrR family transcriptional regulator
LVRQQRAVTTHEAIVRGAADVFEKYGYGEASVSEITESAGVTKGGLYFHYKSKEALALAVINEQHRIATEAGEVTHSMDCSALEMILWTLRSFSDLLHSDVVVRAGIRLTFEASAFSVAVTHPYEDWIASFEALLHRAIGEGDISKDVDAAEFARLIVGAYTGVQMVSNVLTLREDLLVVAAGLWKYLLPSILAEDRKHLIPKLQSIWASSPPTLSPGIR